MAKRKKGNDKYIDKYKNSSLLTRSVHSGEERFKYADSVTVPIVQTSTYIFKDSAEIASYTSKKLLRFEYGRYGGPTQQAAEGKLHELGDCFRPDAG